MHPSPKSGTIRKLVGALLALVVVFGASAAYSLWALGEVQDSLVAVRRREQGVRTALLLGSAVRDQYAHLAHSIILGNDTHLQFYTEAQRRVLQVAGQVRPQVESAEEREILDSVEKADGKLDQIFRERILPAILARDSAAVAREHGQALRLVFGVQDQVEVLVSRFEASMERDEVRAREVGDAAFRWTLGLLAGSVLLAGAVAFWIGRSVARPVARLAEGTAKLASGDLTARIDLATRDEFGDLAQRFNEMAVSLAEHQQKLVQSEKLAGIGRLAAGVAHEINNPLGVILGYARLLSRQADPSACRDLKVIEEETLRAQEIVEGLLELARPPRDKPEQVDLREVCDEVVERLKETEALAGREVTVEGTASVVGQGRKLRQVVLNLVRNAGEAAGKGGKVGLQLRRDAATVRIAVSDSGKGVSPEVKERLFEPFFTTKERGTGLGLAVSEAIARAHGGSVELETAEGGGARFVVVIPEKSTADN